MLLHVSFCRSCEFTRLSACVVAFVLITSAFLVNQSHGQQTKKPSPPAEINQEKKSDDGDSTVLFDGTDLKHFRGYKSEKIGKGWKIEEGVLMFDGSGGGDLTTKAEFDNFELSFDWKISKGGNSGVMYRVSLGDGAPYLSGPEYQILDDAGHGDGARKTTSAAALYALYTCNDKKLNAVGSWNSARIVLNGNHVEHWLNGRKVVEAEISGDDWNERVGKSKFKSWKKFGKNKTGHLCFQDHGNKVWFRNIVVKKLTGK